MGAGRRAQTNPLSPLRIRHCANEQDPTESENVVVHIAKMPNIKTSVNTRQLRLRDPTLPDLARTVIKN